jgi:hypothetical protein
MSLSHSAHASPPQRLSYRWWIAAIVVVAAAVFGGWGMWLHEAEHKHPIEWLSIVYHTMQLFLLHAPHLESPVNWQLHLGRLLAALVVFWVVIRGVTALFRAELRLYWTRLSGGHVVICGLGRLGRQLATEYHNGGNGVVVIEADADRAATSPAGVLVVNGDACEVDTLRRAGATSASKLIAVCDDVQTNVAIVATVRDLLHESTASRISSRVLESWLFVPDAQLRQLLKRDQLIARTDAQFRVNVRGLDLFSLAARQAFQATPLDSQMIDRNSAAQVHLIIVGFGTMGQRLAVQAAHIGHFANRKPPRITVLENPDSANVNKFLTRYKHFPKLAAFNPQPFSPDDADPEGQILKAIGTEVHQLTTLALCWESRSNGTTGETQLFEQLQHDDAVNLKLALGLHQSHAAAMPRTLMFQTRSCGFARLFGGAQPADWGDKLTVFGTIEQTCALDTLAHESTDVVAKHLHEVWVETELAGGKQPDSKPSHGAWDRIPEIYRESNRHAADHIPVKLRAIGRRAEKLMGHRARLTTFEGEEHTAVVELLAEMEHARWCAERMLAGYSYAPGPRDDINKTRPDIVPWEELDEGTRKYDREQVKAIPKALERAGLGIYKVT